MKIIMDFLTPKQCMFLGKIAENLEKRGHEVFKTARRYREVLQILELRKLDAKIIGEHGGKDLANKLRASAQRIMELTSIFEEVKPDVAVSFSSPEMARVAFGLKTPHICINDSPHAEAVAKLTLPLSEKLLTPWLVPKKVWVRFGIPSSKIVQYRALDPWVWLKEFKPNGKVLSDLGLDRSKPIITFRTEETFAAYLLGNVHGETVVIPTIERLLSAKRNVQIVIVPRYDEQIKALEDAFKGKVIVCNSIVDGPSLLSYTSIFVGAGGTMTAEAALLGVPTFSCYPGEPFLIEKYLAKKGLVKRETDPQQLTRMILRTLDRLDQERKKQFLKVQEMIKKFEDPIDAITREVESTVKKGTDSVKT